MLAIWIIFRWLHIKLQQRTSETSHILALIVTSSSCSKAFWMRASSWPRGPWFFQSSSCSLDISRAQWTLSCIRRWMWGGRKNCDGVKFLVCQWYLWVIGGRSNQPHLHQRWRDGWPYPFVTGPVPQIRPAALCHSRTTWSARPEEREAGGRAEHEPSWSDCGVMMVTVCPVLTSASLSKGLTGGVSLGLGGWNKIGICIKRILQFY